MNSQKKRLHLAKLVHPRDGDKESPVCAGNPTQVTPCSGPVRAHTRTGPCVSHHKHKEQMKNTLTAIIPLEQTPEGQPTVNARDLHEFLNIGKEFANWIKDQIRDWGFTEGQDYLKFDSPKMANQKGRGGDRRSVEYHLSLDMAKELSMVSRSARGREARRYFIECEKRLLRGESAFAGLSLDSLMREVQRRMCGSDFLSELARRALPLGDYGEDGKFGFRRATWTRSRGRMLEAAKLATQLQLFELLGGEPLSLS